MDGASLLTVSLTSGETFTLAIGGQTEDGSYVYAALEAPAPAAISSSSQPIRPGPCRI